MSLLRSLAFTAVAKTEVSPVQLRRRKLIERLEEQKLLAKDPSFTRTVRKWQKIDGARTMTEKKSPLRPWWIADDKGQIVLSVFVGYRPVEFEKGKTGIVIGPLEKLPVVIDTLITAIRAGELGSSTNRPRKAIPTAKPKVA